MGIRPVTWSLAGRGGLALLALALATSGCATAPPKPSEQTRADEALAGRVSTALNADATYFFRHVNVQVDDGVAALSGYVWSAQALYRAREIARGVPGVTRVATNDLELERDGLNTGRSR